MKRITVISLAIVVSMALTGCMAGFEMALAVVSAVGDGVGTANGTVYHPPTVHTSCLDLGDIISCDTR